MTVVASYILLWLLAVLSAMVGLFALTPIFALACIGLMWYVKRGHFLGVKRSPRPSG